MVQRIGLDGIGYIPARTQNTTYIQNNFYGTSMFAQNAGVRNGCCCCGNNFNNFGYIGTSCFSNYGSIGYPPPPPPSMGQYNYGCCNSGGDGDISNFNKWMLGLGVGAEIVGIGIKAFSNNKV